jgi:uncharacterized tellurite resistance protein B-like protein
MALLDSLKRWLNPELPDATQPDPVLAAGAALMAEIMRADGTYDPQERAALLSLLMAQSGCSAEVGQTLLAEAEVAVEEAHDLFQFTSLINTHCDAEARIAIVEKLWKVAFADGNLDQHEQHLIKRIADLLYVRHSDVITCKKRARAAVLGA